MKVELTKFEDYLRGKHYSECTIRAYVDGVRDYMRHGFETISETEEHVYKEMLKAENKKGKTVNARIFSLNAYNKWVGLPVMEGVKINEDPFAVNGMDLEDYYKLLDNLLKDKKYKWYIIIKTLASTGMRIGEATTVTFGDIRRGYCVVFGKGGKARTIYFSHSLQETLFMYIKDKRDDELVIPFSTQYVRTALNNIKKRYRMNCICSPHEYRRLFARQMFETTHDVALIKGLLGHESVNMTSHYIKKTQKQALTLYAKAQTW